MKDFQKKLRAIKESFKRYQNTTIDDLREEINKLQSKAYQDELEAILSENDEEIESIESYDMLDLVISDKEIFESLMQRQLSELGSEIDNLCWEVRCSQVYQIEVEVDKSLNFVYSYKNYRHKNYQKVYNHYKKSISKTSSWQQVRKDDEVYKKQRDILARLIDKDIKTSTVVILKTYNFIDESLRNIIERLYNSLTTLDYCYLHVAQDINYGIKWFQKFKTI